MNQELDQVNVSRVRLKYKEINNDTVKTHKNNKKIANSNDMITDIVHTTLNASGLQSHA